MVSLLAGARALILLLIPPRPSCERQSEQLGTRLRGFGNVTHYRVHLVDTCTPYTVWPLHGEVLQHEITGVFGAGLAA